MNLAEIRVLFVHDMGTSVEGLQPCRLFPGEGEAVCVCVCWMYGVYVAYRDKKLEKSEKKSEFGNKCEQGSEGISGDTSVMCLHWPEFTVGVFLSTQQCHLHYSVRETDILKCDSLLMQCSSTMICLCYWL